MRDGWLLAVGTLTALRVPPPRSVDRATARTAVLVAPLAVLPLAVGVALLAALGHAAGTPSPVVAVLVLALLALGSRALHWDGLSDTVDGFTASYRRERALEVMKSGTSGPAGVVATVLVVALQATALSAVLAHPRGGVLAGVLVCVSRGALALTCMRGVPAARRDGLGNPLAGVVPVVAAAALWLLGLGATVLALGWSGGDWWRAAVAVALAAAVVLVLVRRAVTRFGGVTGDVYGAGIELALAALLVAVA